MARQNVPFLAFNRGLLSPKALARVDIDRTRLSAEVYTNWLPKTQGSMRLRPGTKYYGSSINDTGAEWLEFVAATDDSALIEMTDSKMRIWVPSDTGHSWETPVQSGADVPIARPKVDTTVSLSDTGWSNTSTGGTLLAGSSTDILPTMSAATTNGVTITASSENASGFNQAWKAADDSTSTFWLDTGEGHASTLPSWWSVDFGAGNTKAVTSYSIRCGSNSAHLDNAPARWSLLSGDFDTGTYATDTGKWTLSDTQGSETGWSVSQKRTYETTEGDTGTVTAKRHWRFYFRELNGDTELIVAEIEMFTAASAAQVQTSGGVSTLNAKSIGGLARREKQVVVSDTGTEHSLAVNVSRGPVTLRVGSTQRDDDYISETELGTGYHNLAFNPAGNFWVTLQTDETVDRIIQSVAIGDSGTVELTTPYDADDVSNIRYDQSADVVYLDCEGVHPYKIERRGTGRSWSIVKYQPNNGPFLPGASSSARLSVSQKYGNTTLNSDIPFFGEGHTGALVRLFHGAQSGLWPLGALDAKTDAIKVTGISDTGDTGTPSQGSERRITIDVTGTYSGTLQLERSFEGPESGFHPVSTSKGYIKGGTTSTDTGTFGRVINDPDDNTTAWYRIRMSAWTSGTALVSMTYPHGGVNGIGRITDYQSTTACGLEVLSRFSDTGTTDVWQEGAWSDAQGFPTAPALHGGRLLHSGESNLWGSVSDDYENFDDETEGDAAPLSRTLGSGPVDDIVYLLSLLRLIIGTSGAEMALRSSSLDEPVTVTNSSVKGFSTQGSANVRAIKVDTKGVFVQRSGKRVCLIGFGQGVDALGDYEVSELTLLVPDLLAAGVVSIAVQRQPDTRIHCVLANGKVAILTYEPQEDVICWTMWEGDTGTSPAVERAAVLPGVGEDKVYYHVRRTINGATKRYLERWATEAESIGDTGLSYLADCAKFFTDTGRATALTGFSHLAAESVVVWGDDTGQSQPGRDYSPDVAGVQTRYTVSGAGGITLTEAAHHAVAGLPYKADWKSTKLAYAAQGGTALGQVKRSDKIAIAVIDTHNNSLFLGSDTGNLDPLPRTLDEGATVSDKKIYSALDAAAFPIPGKWATDSRIHIRAKSPRPAHVLALIPTVSTNEKL